MKKRLIKLTEGDLYKIVENTMKVILKEGHTNIGVYEEFQSIREQLGDDVIISAMYDWMSQDSIESLIKHLKNQYDIHNDDIEGVDYPHITDWD